MHLLQTLIFLLLVANVAADHLFIPPDGRREIPARPEALPHESAPMFSIHASQVYRALALDGVNHLRHSVFRQDSNHHVNMVGQQMPLSNPAPLLLSQATE